MEGQVGRSSSDGGGGKVGGVDETMNGHIDEEVEVGEEVSTSDGMETSATMKSHSYLLPAKDSCRVL